MINVTVRGDTETDLGTATLLKIFKDGYERMTWEDVWQAFTERYPGRWAVQVFPPESELVNGKNVYHLFLLPQEPRGMNIKRGI